MDNLPKGKYDLIAVEGAILIEAKTYGFFDEMWVVTLPKETAMERVKVRNPDLSDEQIQDRIDRQITDEERLKYAKFSYNSQDSFYENKKKILDYLKQLKY